MKRVTGLNWNFIISLFITFTTLISTIFCEFILFFIHNFDSLFVGVDLYYNNVSTILNKSLCFNVFINVFVMVTWLLWKFTRTLFNTFLQRPYLFQKNIIMVNVNSLFTLFWGVGTFKKKVSYFVKCGSTVIIHKIIVNTCRKHVLSFHLFSLATFFNHHLVNVLYLIWPLIWQS